MPTLWTNNYYDFVVFTDTISCNPVFSALSDTLAFNESVTHNHIVIAFSDGITSWSDGFKIGGIHHVGLEDTMTFADGMMKGSPQLISDRMILIDEFDRADNLLHDTLNFEDDFAGMDSTGITDTSLVFTDTFSLNFIWGQHTAGVEDTLTFVDYMNYLYSPQGPLPNPWIPNYPTTQFNSLNPTCEESRGS